MYLRKHLKWLQLFCIVIIFLNVYFFLNFYTFIFYYVLYVLIITNYYCYDTINGYYYNPNDGNIILFVKYHLYRKDHQLIFLEGNLRNSRSFLEPFNFNVNTKIHVYFNKVKIKSNKNYRRPNKKMNFLSTDQ